jgi:hypothetical protein
MDAALLSRVTGRDRPFCIICSRTVNGASFLKDIYKDATIAEILQRGKTPNAENAERLKAPTYKKIFL